MTNEATLGVRDPVVPRSDGATEAIVATLQAISVKLSEDKPQKQRWITPNTGMSLAGVVILLGGMWTVASVVGDMRVEQGRANESTNNVVKRVDETNAEMKRMGEKLDALRDVVAGVDKRLSYVEGRNAGTKDGGK